MSHMGTRVGTHSNPRQDVRDSVKPRHPSKPRSRPSASFVRMATPPFEQIAFTRLVIGESRRLPWIAEEFYHAGKEPIVKGFAQALRKMTASAMLRCERMQASFAAVGFGIELAARTRGRRQAITIRSQGTDIRGVDLVLERLCTSAGYNGASDATVLQRHRYADPGPAHHQPGTFSAGRPRAGRYPTHPRRRNDEAGQNQPRQSGQSWERPHRK